MAAKVGQEAKYTIKAMDDKGLGVGRHDGNVFKNRAVLRGSTP